MIPAERISVEDWESALGPLGDPPKWAPDGYIDPEPPEGVLAEAELGSSQLATDGWPHPPEQAAYHGLAGRVVAFADPFTEADPVALLATFLTTFGCALNAGPHARVGAERHPARLFIALIGRSSTARKGSSWAPIRELFTLADPGFVAQRIVGGLGSGEALIHAVRDGDGDAGVADKRALVFAPEFASILRVMGRQGSILSVILREAWDSGRLHNTVKTNPATATGEHIAMLGHSTADELARDLTDTDARSGFGNRSIYLAVRRSKLLPSPPPWDEVPVANLAADVQGALEEARRRTALTRDRKQRRGGVRCIPTSHATDMA